jgi:hypothetical protein
MIDPAINAAILTSINALQVATLLPDPCSKWALIGAIQVANAACGARSYETIEAELNHIIQEAPVIIGGRTVPGYTQAALEALS